MNENTGPEIQTTAFQSARYVAPKRRWKWLRRVIFAVIVATLGYLIYTAIALQSKQESKQAAQEARLAATEAQLNQVTQYINIGIAAGIYPTVQAEVDRYNAMVAAQATSTKK